MKNFSEELEEEYIEWCQDGDLDPDNEESREMFKEMKSETGDAYWDSMDDDDRDGWEGNISRSFD